VETLLLLCSVLEKIPTKLDAAHFGHTEYIEDAFRAMAVTPDDISAYAAGTIEEVVSPWFDSCRLHGKVKQPAQAFEWQPR
jgi:hypothetical protein